jgi:HPt (histidine-containing phosphotransfer) domain-containing protein
LKIIYHKASLIDRVDGDIGFAHQLIGMGIQEIKLQLANLNTIIEREVWEELKDYAHRLKGLCRSISFTLLGDLFAKLEELAKSDIPDKERIQNLYKTIELEYNFIKESDILDD